MICTPGLDRALAISAWVEISGPESQVRGVGEVIAQVSLDGHARTFEDHVPVLSPDPLVQVQPGAARMRICSYRTTAAPASSI